MARIGIIGAGLAGLVLARGLAERHEVSLFEKSRGVGGRLATRYAGDFEFDHGAQFFTARTKAFQEFLAPLTAAGHTAPWLARFAEVSGSEVTASRRWDESYPHYVGVPRMNVIGKVLGQGLDQRLDLRLDTRVEAVRRDGNQWRLKLASAESEAVTVDWLLVTAPLAQARALLGNEIDERATAAIGDRTLSGCYALMLGFESPPELGYDAALVKNADISWMSVNSSKPGRRPEPTMVVHATNRWADAHMDMELDAVLEHMLAEVSRVAGIDAHAAVHKAVHRWRYANAPKQYGESHYLATDQRLGLAGDWWIRGRVESAFSSGYALLAALEESGVDVELAAVCAN